MIAPPIQTSTGMALTGKQRQFLRGLAHHKQPVVMIGSAGLTESVVAELEQTLAIHELIKIRIPASSSEKKQVLHDAIRSATSADWVQTIGRIMVFFRANETSRITPQLPDGKK